MSNEDPVSHYNRITNAWQYLLGENFHFGYFLAADESLGQATENLTTLMAQKASIDRETSVLDVGCGIGNPACTIASQYGCRVTGITTSEAGVKDARRRAAEKGLQDRVIFEVADAMDNRLPDASFDRIWALESSHLMPRKDALLKECARVLRPGGRLSLCDIILKRELPLSEVLSRSNDFLHLHYAFGRAKMETLKAYQRLAEKAQLRVLELVDVSSQTLPTFTHWQYQVESNKEKVHELLGAEGLEHFRASCRVLRELWEQDVLGYGLVVATKDI